MEEKEIEKNRHNQGLFFNGLFWGILLGGVTFFLLGTKEGKNSSKKILEKGKKILKFLEEVLGSFEEEKEEIKEEVANKSNLLKAEVQDKVIDLERQIKQQEEKIKKTLASVNQDFSKFREGAVKQVNQIKKRFFKQKGKILKKTS